MNSAVILSSVVETVVEIGESVRGRDVYIIQTGTKQVSFVVLLTFIKVILVYVYLLNEALFICRNNR